MVRGLPAKLNTKVRFLTKAFTIGATNLTLQIKVNYPNLTKRELRTKFVFAVALAGSFTVNSDVRYHQTAKLKKLHCRYAGSD